MKRLLLLIAATLCGLFSFAQLLTWTPAFPKETDPITITMDATKGNQGLQNYTPTTDVYVHIGVITNKSTNPDDWKYVPFTWATTPPAGNAVYAGSNKWTYTISGSLRSFFGITDPTESILKIAILFRSGDGNRAQRNADGSNMYIPVYTNDVAVRFSQPVLQPKFTPVPETQPWSVGTNISLTADANKPSTMKLYHNGNVIATSAGNVTTLTGSSTITATGVQQLVAEANDGTSSKFDTIYVSIAPVAPLPAGVRDGINYHSGTSATLVLRAPLKNNVTVIGEFNNWVPAAMNKTPDGKFFWITLNGLTPGTEYAYQYVIDGTIKIADPYTEKVLDPGTFADPQITAATYPNLRPYPQGQTGIVSLLQTQAPTYNWTVNNFTRPDKKGLVIYELLVRDFVAAHDWKTLRDSLNYLKSLGINAIEIMPFNEFENNDSWGYNPDFYFAPDKFYGPKNSLKEFIDSCHRRGIAVIMDMTLNHAFGQAPMVQMYWDGANNRPSLENPWYNPVAKHDFNVGFDMNHESLDTRYFVSRVVEHWLQEYKIDGYRFDLSKGFTQVQTCDNNGENCNPNAMAAYDASRVAIWKRYYDSVQSKSPNSYVILEHFATNSEEIELSNYGMLLWGNMHGAYTEAAKGNVNGSDFSGAIHTVRGWTRPHLVSYMESHDEERIVYKALKEGVVFPSYNIRDTTIALKRMELNAAFLFTIPGPKMLWQFGELGYDYPINYCPDGAIRNGCRTDKKPIRWDYLNDARRKSIYNTYSKLINLRFHPWYKDALMDGTVESSLGTAFKWIKLRTGNDSSDMVVIGNFDGSTQIGAVTFPVQGTWFDYLNNTTFSATGTAQSISLLPGEFRVYVNRNVNNVTTTPVSNIPWNGTAMAAKVFPNPVQMSYTLEISVPQSGNAIVELYNSNGQFLRTVHNGFLTRGSRQISLNRPTTAAGTYFLKITLKGETKTIPLTLQ